MYKICTVVGTKEERRYFLIEEANTLEEAKKIAIEEFNYGEIANPLSVDVLNENDEIVFSYSKN